MGGLSGHMMHPWENRQLRFSDLAKLAMKEKYTEKIDGFGFQFLLNRSTGKLHLIRNKRHIEMGGLGFTGIIAEYGNRPACSAYLAAYTILNTSRFITDLMWLDGEVKVVGDVIFGGDSTLNIVKYDRTFLAIHSVTCNGEEVHMNLPDLCIDQHEVKVLPNGIHTLVRPLLSNDQKLDEFYWYEFLGAAKRMAVSEGKDYFSKSTCDFLETLYSQMMNKKIVKTVLYEEARIKDLGEGMKELVDWYIDHTKELYLETTKKVRGLCTEIGEALKAYSYGILGRGYAYTDEMTEAGLFDDNADQVFEGLVTEYNGELYKWTGTFGEYNRNYWNKIKKN